MNVEERNKERKRRLKGKKEGRLDTERKMWERNIYRERQGAR